MSCLKTKVIALQLLICDRFFAKLETQFGDFKGKGLISYFTFNRSGETWEVHLAGKKFVCLLSGQVDLILEQDGAEHKVRVNTLGAYVLAPHGVWHTA